MKKQIVELIRKNPYKNGYGIDRENFRCLEVNIPTSGEWLRTVKEKAKQIEKRLNVGQANSSKPRDEETVKIDNLSGLIAEHACDKILRLYLKSELVDKPTSETSKNQIDIVLTEERKTIEVRSSCVKNGIDFALFAKDSEGVQYFDVIGPYSNGYKPGEVEKDYYMRVLYHCDKKSFMDLLEEPTLTLYITGGATKAMMNDAAIYKDKRLYPSGGEVEIESDYRVVPLGESLDFDKFIETLKTDLGL